MLFEMMKPCLFVLLYPFIGLFTIYKLESVDDNTKGFGQSKLVQVNLIIIILGSIDTDHFIMWLHTIDI